MKIDFQQAKGVMGSTVGLFLKKHIQSHRLTAVTVEVPLLLNNFYVEVERFGTTLMIFQR